MKEGQVCILHNKEILWNNRRKFYQSKERVNGATILETPEGTLSQIMRHINGVYTTYFNVKRKRADHLFQGRYTSILGSAAFVEEISATYLQGNEDGNIPALH
jgi:hypothetical protein